MRQEERLVAEVEEGKEEKDGHRDRIGVCLRPSDRCDACDGCNADMDAGMVVAAAATVADSDPWGSYPLS